MASLKILLASVVLCASILIGEGIMRGKEATAHSRPYMSSMQHNGKHECGGFLVSSQWVMTAAHCVKHGYAGRKIVLGAHSLSQAEDTKQSFDIIAAYSHPNFNPANFDHDISLIKLDRPAVESDAVKSVKFAREGAAELKEGDEVDTAGWGALDNLENRPDKLQELTIAVINRDSCSRHTSYGNNFTPNMVCAGKRRMDTCDGDSGGPLLHKGIVVGITSNGGACGSSRKPGLYSIVSHFTEWIDRMMAQ